MKYVIVEAQTVEELNGEMSARSENGWTLHGNPFVVEWAYYKTGKLFRRKGSGKLAIRLGQAMVKDMKPERREIGY